MALNQEKIKHVSKFIELMFKEELHCLHNGFLQMESQLNIKLQMNYLQKDNWAHLLKCWHGINSSYKVLHVQTQPT